MLEIRKTHALICRFCLAANFVFSTAMCNECVLWSQSKDIVDKYATLCSK